MLETFKYQLRQQLRVHMGDRYYGFAWNDGPHVYLSLPETQIHDSVMAVEADIDQCSVVLMGGVEIPLRMALGWIESMNDG
jgi:hypothetical protein